MYLSVELKLLSTSGTRKSIASSIFVFNVSMNLSISFVKRFLSLGMLVSLFSVRNVLCFIFYPVGFVEIVLYVRRFVKYEVFSRWDGCFHYSGSMVTIVFE